MTSLTDKMEGLRRDCEILDDGQYELAELSEVTVYNQALDKCIALVKAEEVESKYLDEEPVNNSKNN